MSTILILAVVFCASFVLTMVGLGGGLVYAPLFVLIGFPLPAAVSSSLFLNGVAAGSAAVTYYRRKLIDLRTAVPLLISSSLSAPLGALLTGLIDQRIFSAVMALIVFLAAVRMLFGGQAGEREAAAGKAVSLVGGTAIGVAAGLIGGLLGIGGGVFIVPLLIFGLKMPPKSAAATSVFIVVFSSFSGFLAHLSLSGADWGFILPAALLSFAGGQLGSKIMSERLKGRGVRRIFGLVLLVFCVKLLQKVML